GPAQNYMESLFLPIFERVQGDDLSIRVVQFTWGDEAITDSVAAAAAEADIGYDVRKVLRKPLAPATAAMIAKGAMDVVALAKKHDIDVLFPRAAIPSAMTLLAEKMLPDVKVFYDADGFMADERIEFGGWDPEGFIYRLFRDVEAQICRRADSIMTRTQKAKEILVDRVGDPLDPDIIHVIPNAKDVDEFHPGEADDRRKVREALGVADEAPLVIYVGSLGPHYHPGELLEYFEKVWERDERARLVVLTGNRDQIDERMHRVSFPEEAMTVTRVAPDEVPAYVAAADVGLAFRAPSFSQLGVSPIKVGEYLLCGTPVLSTAGVGDLDEQLGGRHTGRLLDELDDDHLAEAADWLYDDVVPNRDAYRERCREVGVDEFGMDACVRRYRRAFEDCK
ncbi:MAG: glycosyltransferase, partial [Persicimonas sp.]